MPLFTSEIYTELRHVGHVQYTDAVLHLIYAPTWDEMGLGVGFGFR